MKEISSCSSLLLDKYKIKNFSFLFFYSFLKLIILHRDFGKAKDSFIIFFNWQQYSYSNIFIVLTNFLRIVLSRLLILPWGSFHLSIFKFFWFALKSLKVLVMVHDMDVNDFFFNYILKDMISIFILFQCQICTFLPKRIRIKRCHMVYQLMSSCQYVDSLEVLLCI